MNPEIKTKWVAALRGGEFEQAQKQLKYDNKYCCLGVLCELYRRETGVGEWAADDYSSVRLRFLSRWDSLPAQVYEWAGLRETDPQINHSDRTLAGLNDGGASFSQIADIIDAEL